MSSLHGQSLAQKCVRSAESIFSPSASPQSHTSSRSAWYLATCYSQHYFLIVDWKWLAFGRFWYHLHFTRALRWVAWVVMLNFFQYDQYVGAVATVAWATILWCRAQGESYYIRDLLKQIGKTLVRSIFAGPGAAFIALMWDRDLGLIGTPGKDHRKDQWRFTVRDSYRDSYRDSWEWLRRISYGKVYGLSTSRGKTFTASSTSGQVRILIFACNPATHNN